MLLLNVSPIVRYQPDVIDINGEQFQNSFNVDLNSFKNRIKNHDIEIHGIKVDAIYFTTKDNKYVEKIISENKYDDGTPMYQLEHTKFKNDTEVHIAAPNCPRRIITKEAHESNYISGPVSSEKSLILMLLG